MDKTKNEKSGQLRKQMTLIMLIGAGLCFILSFIINDKDLKMTLLIVGFALFSAVFITRLLKSRFGYKPTLEEIEERQFGKLE